MNAALIAPWLVLGLAAALAATAIAALAARSLFAMCISLAAAGALAAALVFAAGGGDGALALAAFGVGVGPVLLLGGVLLSARAVKRVGPSLPVLSVVAAAAAVAAVAAVAPELDDAPRLVGGGSAPGFWLAALLFVAAIGCAGVLGYGERGVLERNGAEQDL